MKALRKSAAGLALGVALAGAWIVGGRFVKDVEFSRAQERVDATRAQIANMQDVAAVYKAVGKVVEPSVVSIDVKKAVDTNRLLRRFFPDRNGDGQPDVPENAPFDMPQQFQQQGTGSGVIIELDGKTGYIVTNNHVAGGALVMDVNLADGRQIKNAKLVGADPKTDLAVIKIEADHLIAAKWGDSEGLEKGDVVLAFGSPFGYVGSMTQGIVSALHRQAGIITGSYSYENFIQVDAPINPGNSGGPLVNLRGEVVGINTAIATESGGFQGVGFAIPSNQAQFVYKQIKESGKVVRGWLGVEINDVNKNPELASALGYAGGKGVMVQGIMRKAPANGQLTEGDIVTSLNGRTVNTVQELRNAIAKMPPDTDVKMNIFRAGKTQDVTVKLGVQPDDVRAVTAAPPEARPNTPGALTPDVLGLVRIETATNSGLQRYGVPINTQGVIVQNIRNSSPAAMAGMAQGDVITAIDATPVKSVEELTAALAKASIKAGIRISVVNSDGSRLLFARAE